MYLSRVGGTERSLTNFFIIKKLQMEKNSNTHTGRVALVTEAAQGIGQAIAIALAGRGADVIVTDLKEPKETADKIGSAAHPMKLDVTNEENWKAVALQSSELNGVDIVIN